MKKLFFILLLACSCSSNQQSKQQIILDEQERAYKRYSILYDKGISIDSLKILGSQLDSLNWLISDFPNFSHSWDGKPYKIVMDELNNVYKISEENTYGYEVFLRDTHKQILWNMEDATIISKIITKILGFEPEKYSIYGSLVWNARMYTISLYSTGNKTLIIKINEN